MKPLQKFKATEDLSHVSLEKWRAQRMFTQGYRFIGKHSAIKICEWTKRGIREQDPCYKQEFYCINSHRCVQMSPVAFFCDFNCNHCWRSLNFTLPKADFEWDSPEVIFNGCLKEQEKIIQGFKGDRTLRPSRIAEAEKPKHFAISLSGEPTLYPHLPEFIDLIKKNDMTSFLVTNGAHPEIIQKLLNYQPTNLYVTFPSFDEESYKKECNPIIKDGWEKIHETLSLLNKFSCKTVIRLTLNKKTNMYHPEKYAEVIDKYQPDFIECKSYMAIGGSRAKMGPAMMPSFSEIISFAKEIEKHSSYTIINSSESSSVVLLSKK